MTDKPIRLGVIGLGAIGQNLLRAFAEHPALELKAVCDLDAELARQTSQKYNNIDCYTDYRTMLTAAQMELVYLAVPPRWHYQAALEILSAGKHLLCEKPLALNLKEGREMTEQAQRTGLVTALNLSMHYAPGVKTFVEKARQPAYFGELQDGQLMMVFPQWPRSWQQNPWIGGREQGGPVRECTPHLFEVILEAFGPVRRLQAVMTYQPDPNLCEKRAAGTLELDNGKLIRVNVETNLDKPEEVSLTVRGSQQTIGLVQWRNPVVFDTDNRPEPMAVPETTPGLLDNLVLAIRGQKADLLNFEQGLALQQVQDGWERSAQAHGEWVTL